MTGTGTPPAAALRGGDLVALTTKSTLTAAGAVVVRMLLAADKTAHYKEGTPVAGILGVQEYDASTNSLGQAVGNTAPAGVAVGSGVTYSFPSMAGGIPQDPVTNRSRDQVYSAGQGNVFVAALDATATVGSPALNNTLAGLILTVASGVTTYTIDTGAAAADQCLEIINCDESDPLYVAATAGCRVFFRFLAAFDQSLTGVNYSTQ